MNLKSKAQVSLQALLSSKNVDALLPTEEETELSCSSVQLFEISSDVEDIFNMSSVEPILSEPTQTSQNTYVPTQIDNLLDPNTTITELRTQISSLEHDNITLVEELDKITKIEMESAEQMLSLHNEVKVLTEELSASKASCSEISQNVKVPSKNLIYSYL